MSTGLHAAATIEAVLTPRVSLRGEVGRDWIGVDRPGFPNGFRPLFFTVNIVYNWERGVWRRYVTAGLGVYRYTTTISSEALLDPTLRADLIALGLTPGSGIVEGSDKKLGVNLGGGLECFISRQTTIAGDVRYHAVGDVVTIVPFEGSFVTLSVGLKRYF